MSRPKWIIAHRGYHPHGVRENTLSAFEHAIKLGVDWIEFDVRRLADGTLVVHHDEAIGGRALSEQTCGELHETAIPFGIAIPTFRQVLDLCRDRIYLNIELKHAGCEEDVLRGLYNSRWHVNEYLITSFIPKALQDVRFAQPGAVTGFLTQQPDFEDAVLGMEAVKADYLLPSISNVDASILTRAAELGVMLLPWTVNHREEMKLALPHPSVAGIITDQPYRALNLRGLVGR